MNAPIGTVVSSALESSAVAVLRLLSNLGAIVALHMLVVFVIFRGAALHNDLINHFLVWSQFMKNLMHFSLL